MSSDPLGMAEKRQVIRSYLGRHRLRTLVETGLYQGRGSGMEMLDLLDTYVVVDNDVENCEAAREVCPAAEVICGDSAKVLPGILTGLSGSALFWLDAHSWVGEEFGDDPPGSPLLAELAAITAWEHAAGSVVLIDDLRQMADQPLAQPGWPLLTELRKAAGLWVQHEQDDILRLTPRSGEVQNEDHLADEDSGEQ